jgi:hypothetical protein
LRRPIAGRLAVCHPVNKQYGHDLGAVQAPAEAQQNPANLGKVIFGARPKVTNPQVGDYRFEIPVRATRWGGK